MPVQIGNTKVYTTKEVETATLFAYNTVRRLLKEGRIKYRQVGTAFEVEHSDLVNYLVEEQDVPPNLADEIIEYRLSNNKVTEVDN